MRSLAFYSRESFLLFFAMAVSLLLSFWLNYRETVINPDAICYLLSAEEIGNQGISAAMKLCGQAKWPFFSFLIYILASITHLSYTTAAYVLNSVFSLFSVAIFILIVKQLGGQLRVLWLAASVILLSHNFNSVREYIIRDHGFWTFYLVSIFFLLRYFTRPTWQIAFAWSISLIIATLFRIEGAIFLFGLPFLSLFYTSTSWSRRLKYFFILHMPLLLLGCFFSIWLLLHPSQTFDQLGRLTELGQQFQHGFGLITERYHSAKVALAENVLTIDSIHDAGLVLILVLLAWYAVSFINNLSFIYGLLLIFAWQKKVFSFTLPATLVLLGYLIVNFVVTLGFMAEHLFLSKRYLIALSLVLMLLVPFALDHLIQRSSDLRYRLFLFVAIIGFCLSSLGGVIDFGYSKSYIHDAGDWLAKNVPANASLYVNDYQLMYYSKHFGRSIFTKLQDYNRKDAFAYGQWKQYDYIALRVDKNKILKMASILHEIPMERVQFFSNKRGDKILIYRVNRANSGENVL